MKLLQKSLIASIPLSALLLLAGCNKSANKGPEEEETGPSKRPAELSWADGQAVLTVQTATQKKLGLATATLARSVRRSELGAPAVVLSVQDLVNSRNNYIAVQTQFEKAHTEADVAGKEYSRLKTLFAENQSTSEKSFQSAEAVSRTRAADLTAAEQQVTLEEAAVRQEWGTVVTKWVVEDSPELQQVLNQRQMLVQITLRSGENVELPSQISLELPDGTRRRASVVAPVPKLDPRIQGRSYLYVCPVEPGLAPGTNLLAHLAVGARMTGVIVPASAVVWSAGKAWIYQQTAKDRFVQRPVATNIPVENGFFVARGLQAGDKIVTQGAQALLSAQAFSQGGGTVPDED